MAFLIKMITLLSMFLFFAFSAKASVYLQNTFNYQMSVDDDNSATLEHTSMRNTFFIGASYEKNGQFILGQNIHIWKKESEDQTLGEQEVYSMLEIGPRVILYLNKNRNLYISAAYHFYSKGEREFAGVTEEIKGTALMGSIGLQRKILGNVHLGFSVSYHKFSMSESVINNNSTIDEQSHTSIFPALDLSYRF